MKVLATHLVWNHNFTETYGIRPPDVELNWRSAVEIRSQSTNNLGIRHQRLLVHYVVQSRSPNNLGIRHQRCSDTGEMTVMIRANNDHKSGQQERSRDTSVRELFFFFSNSDQGDFWCLIPKSQRLAHSVFTWTGLSLTRLEFLVSYTQISTIATSSYILPKSQRPVHSLTFVFAWNFWCLIPRFQQSRLPIIHLPNLRDWYTLAHIRLRLKFLVSYTQISTLATSSHTPSLFHLGSSGASSCLLVVSYRAFYHHWS